MSIVIIINGSGLSGKDTIINYVKESLPWYPIMNASSVDNVKKAAKVLGWQGNKTPKSRKFLYDLKQLSIQYNDNPTYQLLNHIKENRAKIYFFHIRESSEIDKIKKELNDYSVDVVTWVVHRHKDKLGNDGDDDIYGYNYDFHIDNSGKIGHTKKQINTILNKMGVM